MITAFFFYIHIIFALYVFTKRWQEESLGAAFLVLIFIGIIFSVGWTLSYFLVSLIIEPEGFGKFYNRDTISLTLLTILEFFFYSFYFKGRIMLLPKKERSNSS
ncbi:MAG: hypothetical protein KJ666_01690 [Bacteroidetes bacterium]|nr:hypothetical protein [Bacteroidota bacterium]